MSSARITAAGIVVVLSTGLMTGCTSASTEGGVLTATPVATATTVPENTAPAAPQDFEVGQEVSIDDRKAVEEAGLAVYKDRKGNVTVWDPSTNKMPAPAIQDIQAAGQTKAPKNIQATKDSVAEMRRAGAWTNGLIPVAVTQGASYDEGGNLLFTDGWGYRTTGDILEYGASYPTYDAALAAVKAKIAASPNAEKYTIIDLG